MAVASRFSSRALVERYETLVARAMPHMNRWRNIADLFWPAKSDILRGEQWGWDDARTRTLELYDGTGLRARRLLAGNLQAAVTNPAIQWFRLRLRNDEVNEDGEVAQWLTTVDDRMLLAYNASNFYAEAFQHYSQLGVFATACTFVGQRQKLWLERGQFALRFQTLYPGSYVIAESEEGQVNTVMRRLLFTPRQALAKWGEEAPARVHRIMRGRAEAPKDEKEPYLHAVCPREDRLYNRQDNRNLPWADVTVDLTDKDEIVEEGGWEEFPFVVSRWEREGMSGWGYGPADEAMPDAISLNLTVKNWLDMVELQVKPPLEVLNQAFLGVLRFAPLHINIVEQPNAIRPLLINGDAQTVIAEVARLQKQIRDAFHIDDLLALPPPDQKGVRTAFEIAQRIALMQQYMGPVFTMLLSDFLDPLADRVFGLMLRAMVLPPLPMAVLEEAQQRGGQLDVEYDGPLARAQRSGEVQAFDDLMTMGMKIGEATQSMDWKDNFDLDKGIRNTAVVLGNPRDLLIDPRQRDQTRQTRQQQAAIAQQTAVLAEGAKAFKEGAQGMQALQGEMAA